MAKTKSTVLTCSQCGRRFIDKDKGKALSRLRKHLWKDHAAWMTRRIKSGIRKSKKAGNAYHAPGNPFLETVKKVLNPSWTGFAERPIIEKLTGRPYEQVRQETLDAFVAEAFRAVSGLFKK